MHSSVKGRKDDRPSAPDADTLAACRRGDRQAIGRLLGGQTARLHRLIVRLAGPGADAEDLLQSTLAAAIAALPRFRGEAPLDVWLARIAVNAIRTQHRRGKVRPTTSLEVVKNGEEPADAAPLPDRVAEARRRIERLYHHLGALSDRKRIAFLLHMVEGLPVDEVAALMGATRFATRSRIFWAGRALRARARKDPALRDLLDEGEAAR